MSKEQVSQADPDFFLRSAEVATKVAMVSEDLESEAAKLTCVPEMRRDRVAVLSQYRRLYVLAETVKHLIRGAYPGVEGHREEGGGES